MMQGCAFVVLSEFDVKNFQVRVDTGPSFTVNVPRPWFAFGDLGESATAGGYIRMVGEALTLSAWPPSPIPVLRMTLVTNQTLTTDSEPLILTARLSKHGDGIGAALTRWMAFFDIPNSIQPGKYELAVGCKGGAGECIFVPLCTFISTQNPCLSTIKILEAGVELTDPRLKVKDQDIFTVNATQPG